MADYELYGEYNTGDEDRGPERGRTWKIISLILKIALGCILAGVCLTIAFRMIFSGYYPNEIERLFYTDEMRSYAATHELKAETQDIRNPFETEIIEMGEDDRVQQTESRKGYYYADNLILLRDAGVLQCSVRLNKHVIEEIAADYRLENFSFSDSAFDFRLVYKKDGILYSYTPTVIYSDSALMYHYMKLVFEGVTFEDIAWYRLEITPRGADTTAEDYEQLAICIYENHEEYNHFSTYRLKKSEKP